MSTAYPSKNNEPERPENLDLVNDIDDIDDIDGIDDVEGIDEINVAARAEAEPIEETSERNIYTRTGKAAPQVVAPKPREAAAKPTDAAEKEDTQSKTKGRLRGPRRKAKPEVIATKPAAEDAIAPEEVLARAGETGETEVDVVDLPAPASYDSGYAQITDDVEGVVAKETAPAATSASTETIASTGTAVATDQVAEPAVAAAPLDRGTIDFGLLVARLVLGAILIISSLATFFQLGGNPGLTGLEDSLSSHAYPQVLSIAIPTLQLTAGVFLVLGLITPVAAMLAIAVTGFQAIHEISGAPSGVNAFAWEPSVWLAIALLGLALSVQFTGPGIFGVDYGRSWARRPLISSWICAALGLGAAVLMWAFL